MKDVEEPFDFSTEAARTKSGQTFSLADPLQFSAPDIPVPHPAIRGIRGLGEMPFQAARTLNQSAVFRLTLGQPQQRPDGCQEFHWLDRLNQVPVGAAVT